MNKYLIVYQWQNAYPNVPFVENTIVKYETLGENELDAFKNEKSMEHKYTWHGYDGDECKEIKPEITILNIIKLEG